MGRDRAQGGGLAAPGPFQLRHWFSLSTRAPTMIMNRLMRMPVSP